MCQQHILFRWPELYVLCVLLLWAGWLRLFCRLTAVDLLEGIACFQSETSNLGVCLALLCTEAPGHWLARLGHKAAFCRAVEGPVSRTTTTTTTWPCGV